jgi:hypothetical protein
MYLHNLLRSHYFQVPDYLQGIPENTEISINYVSI